MNQKIRIMKKLSFYLLIIFNVQIVSISNAQTSIDEYVQLAVENNPGLKAKFSAYYESLERIPQVGALPDPNVTLGAYILPVETRVGSRVLDFEISQSFPWFGTLAAKKDEASQWAQVKFREFQVSKTELLYKVKSAYYEMYTINASINTQKEYLHILDKQEQELLTKVEAAKASLADVLRTQMKQKILTAELESLIDSYTSLTAQMNALLSRSSSATVNTTTNEINPIDLGLQEELLLDSIMSNNPNIKLLQETNNALESQKVVAKLARSPTMSAGLSYGMIQRRTDVEIPSNGQNILMPRISMGIPLNRKKYDAKVKEVELRQESIAFEIVDQQNTLAFRFTEVKNQYRDAKRNHELYQELTIQAKQTMDILTTSYSTDLKRYEEILDMQSLLLSYELELEKAKAKQHIAIARIEQLMAKGI